MKLPRIFLGITTALLAVAGVAATKAHRAPSMTVYFYTQRHLPLQTCPYYRLTRCTKNGPGSQCFFITVGGTQFPYFTKGGVNIVCSHIVFYNAQ